MKDLIKKILRENEWEWVEETLDLAFDPYEMNGNQLTDFLNRFFRQNKSPRFNKIYVVEYDSMFTIGDPTGLYISQVSADVGDKPFNYAIKSLKNSLKNLTHNKELFDEYQDLYDTLRPLIKEDIREQANDMEWFDVDDMPEPTGIALANIIEEYFKDNELPYYVKIRQDNNVVYIGDLSGNYFTEYVNILTIDNIIKAIEEGLTETYNTTFHKEYLQFKKDIQPLFDKLK